MAHDAMVPPHSAEIEQYVLGAALLDNTAIDLVIQKAGNLPLFYQERHAIIWEAMLRLAREDAPVDILSLHNELARRDGDLEKIGGAPYLAELAAALPSSANVEYHAGVLVEKAMLRQAILQCSRTIQQCYAQEQNGAAILTAHEAAVAGIGERTLQQDIYPVGQILPDVLSRIERAYQNSGEMGIRSGIEDLDRLTGGLMARSYTILAARPSHGKTAFALNIARLCGVPVGFFSLEMDKEQLVYRMLAAGAQVNLQSVVRGVFPEEAWPKLLAQSTPLADIPIYIDDTPNLDIFELEAKARQMVRKHGVELLVVDYLQQMEAPGPFSSLREKIGFISARLNGLKKKLGKPILAISQLSREVEKRSPRERRPRLSDLRESGDLEQDADMVMFVYRPELYGIEEWEGDQASTENTAEIIVAKHRQGPVGSARATFLKEYGIFLNYARYSAGEGVGVPPSESPF